jgi:hypothetical protein
MTTQDKTGEKLVQSIRKTKSTGGTTGGAATTSKAPAAKPAAAKPRAARSTAAKAKAATAATGGYQHGKRVWPD